MKFEDMINNVILGDCYEVIKDIPDKSIDCIYTDIPYLIKKCNESGGFLFKDKNGTRFNAYKEQLKDIKDGIDLSILDEFCKNTNRRYIGIELNPEWHKIAVDRLNNIQANGQQTFFTM